MKSKTIYLLALLLCIVTACKKDTSSPPPQPEPVKKYLTKVLAVGNDGSSFEVESCTWDSLHRLKTYHAGSPHFDAEFYYDSIGRISQMDYCAYISVPRCLYFVFDWKNEKELNGIDIHVHDILFDTTYYNQIRDNYFYDESGRNIKIKRDYANGHTAIYEIEWDGLNITSAKGASRIFINHEEFDDKHSPWSTFPDIFIVGLIADMNSIMLYNPSKNNPIQGESFFYSGTNLTFEYDYDKDGYPLFQYYIWEDGSKTLWYKFEYYE